MRLIGWFAALVTTFALAAPAHALVEARLTYGLLVSNPQLGDLYNGATSIPSVAPNYGLGGDVLVFLPLTGWGFGVRQENLGLTASSGGLDFKSTATRTSAVVAYRFIDTILHVGTLFTYGLSHKAGFDVDESSTNTHLRWEPGSVSSYSAGLEVGVGLGIFILGAEAGYQSLKWNGMTDSSGGSTNKPDTDMSGSYTKVYFGFGI